MKSGSLSLCRTFCSLWSLLPWSTFPAPPSPPAVPAHTWQHTRGERNVECSPFPIAWQPVIFDLDKCLLRERREFSSPDPSDKPTMLLAVLGFSDECFSPLSLHHTQSQHLKCCFPGENKCHGKGRSRCCRRDGALGTHGCSLWYTGDVLKPAYNPFPKPFSLSLGCSAATSVKKK